MNGVLHCKGQLFGNKVLRVSPCPALLGHGVFVAVVQLRGVVIGGGLIGGGRVRAAAGNGVPGTKGRCTLFSGLQCPAVKPRNVPCGAVTAGILAGGGQVRRSGSCALHAICAVDCAAAGSCVVGGSSSVIGCQSIVFKAQRLCVPGPAREHGFRIDAQRPAHSGAIRV